MNQITTAEQVPPASIRQVAYDVLPKDADDELYELADRITEAVFLALCGHPND